MKLLTLALSCFLLVGCSSSPTPTPELPTDSTPSVVYQTDDLSSAILASDGFSQILDTLPLTMALGYYGLDSAPVAGTIYCSMEGGYEGFCVLYFETSDQAKTALTHVAGYLTGQLALEQSMKYKPQDIPKLDDPYLYQKETLVVMAVADDISAVKHAVTSTLS